MDTLALSCDQEVDRDVAALLYNLSELIDVIIDLHSAEIPAKRIGCTEGGGDNSGKEAESGKTWNKQAVTRLFTCHPAVRYASQ